MQKYDTNIKPEKLFSERPDSFNEKENHALQGEKREEEKKRKEKNEGKR